MQQRVKIFTYVSGTGSTVIETALEDHINEWLEQVPGQVTQITQSESERPGVGHHITVCLWYLPETPNSQEETVQPGPGATGRSG